MMNEVVDSPRIDQLKELLNILASEIDKGPGARDMASLCKQYRETLAEIEAIEGGNVDDDEIGEILSSRDGMSDSVRKNRA